jgi:hypothetical protein
MSKGGMGKVTCTVMGRSPAGRRGIDSSGTVGISTGLLRGSDSSQPRPYSGITYALNFYNPRGEGGADVENL